MTRRLTASVDHIMRNEADQIRYVQGDATRPNGEGPRVIAHICNDVGGWGKGFVLAISRRWPGPEAAYRSWYRDREDNDFELGSVQLVAVAEEMYVANIIGQRDIRTVNDEPPVRYWAIEAGLADLADEAIALRASVHMPRIGCGLAGGDWTLVEQIINRTLVSAGIETTVYDL